LLKTFKSFITIFLITTLLFLSCKTLSDDTQQSSAKRAKPAMERPPEYTIISVDISPQDKARRFIYHVLINPGTTKKEMEHISILVFYQAKKENPFNALAVGFYDHSVLLNHGFRFGRVEFAPNGKWSDANTVKTGDYSKLKMVNYLREPDWENALTKTEATIYAKHNKLLNSLLENTTSQEDIEKAEKKANLEIIKKYKITQEELDNIYFRYKK